jgi:hypothetical protein
MSYSIDTTLASVDAYLVSPLDARPYSCGFALAFFDQSLVERFIPALEMEAEVVGVVRLNIMRLLQAQTVFSRSKSWKCYN